MTPDVEAMSSSSARSDSLSSEINTKVLLISENVPGPDELTIVNERQELSEPPETALVNGEYVAEEFPNVLLLVEPGSETLKISNSQEVDAFLGTGVQSYQK